MQYHKDLPWGFGPLSLEVLSEGGVGRGLQGLEEPAERLNMMPRNIPYFYYGSTKILLGAMRTPLSESSW